MNQKPHRSRGRRRGNCQVAGPSRIQAAGHPAGRQNLRSERGLKLRATWMYATEHQLPSTTAGPGGFATPWMNATTSAASFPLQRLWATISAGHARPGVEAKKNKTFPSRYLAQVQSNWHRYCNSMFQQAAPFAPHAAPFNMALQFPPENSTPRRLWPAVRIGNQGTLDSTTDRGGFRLYRPPDRGIFARPGHFAFR